MKGRVLLLSFVVLALVAVGMSEAACPFCNRRAARIGPPPACDPANPPIAEETPLCEGVEVTGCLTGHQQRVWNRMGRRANRRACRFDRRTARRDRRAVRRGCL